MGRVENVFRSDRLRILQSERRYTQQEMADLIGINQSQLQRYLNGRSEPTAAIVARMSKKLHVSSDYLLGLVDHPHELVAILSSDELAFLEAVKQGLDVNALLALVAFLEGSNK